MPRGGKQNPMRLNSSVKPKSPYYVWLREKGNNIFLRRHGDYFDQSPEHAEKMTRIWHEVTDEEKKKYYDMCGKKYNPSGQAAVGNQTSVEPLHLPLQNPSTSHQLRAGAGMVSPEHEVHSSFGSKHRNALQPQHIIDLEPLPKQYLDDLFRNECSKLYPQIKHQRNRSIRAPNRCLGMDFYFIKVALTCTIMTADESLYTFPSEIAILRFSFENGLKARESIRVGFSPMYFGNCSRSLENEILERVEEARAFYKLDPWQGDSPQDAYSKYIDFVDINLPLIYNSEEFELIATTLGALSYPVSPNIDNLYSLQALSKVLCTVFDEERPNLIGKNFYADFIKCLQAEVSYVSEIYCKSHADLNILSNEPNFKCPLAEAYSKLHLLFEFMNQFDILGITEFYKHETHVFCLSNVGARSNEQARSLSTSYTRAGERPSLSNHSHRTEERNNRPDCAYGAGMRASESAQKRVILATEREAEMRRSYTPSVKNTFDNDECFLYLKEMFGHCERYWVVLPEVCFDQIPDYGK